jgi:ketosteroid isomerase-like protein
LLICPNCKLLYEKSTKCIRCGSPLVENTSSEKEEMKAPPPLEINKETPPIQKSKDKKEELRSTPLFDFEEKFPPKPTPKVKKGEPETESLSDMEKTLHEVLRDEQSSPDILPGKTKGEISRSEKIQIKVPSLSFQKIGMIIVILIGGYFIWSIYSHFTPKKPDANVPPSKESTNLLSPRPATPTKPLTPLIEPKVADPPSTHSPPIVSKTSLSDEKEIEHIKKLFENIREANLKKNVDLFMSCYSVTFKDREGKKRETLKNWENFTYINLSYTLREHSISGDTAGVIIEWVIRFSPKAGGKPQESKTVLDVTLNKEPDGWKIKNIKPIS